MSEHTAANGYPYGSAKDSPAGGPYTAAKPDPTYWIYYSNPAGWGGASEYGEVGRPYVRVRSEDYPEYGAVRQPRASERAEFVGPQQPPRDWVLGQLSQDDLHRLAGVSLSRIERGDLGPRGGFGAGITHRADPRFFPQAFYPALGAIALYALGTGVAAWYSQPDIASSAPQYNPPPPRVHPNVHYGGGGWIAPGEVREPPRQGLDVPGEVR